MKRPSLGERALEIGHELSVDRVPTKSKRTRLVCSCGFYTSASLTRAHMWQAATAHLYDALRDAGRLGTGDEDRALGDL